MRRTMLCGVTLLLALGVISGCNSGTKVTPEDENPDTETEPGPVIENPSEGESDYVWHHDATYHWKEDANGIVSGEIDKEEHTLRYIDDLDPNTHLVRCAICGYEDDLAHDWVDLGTTREPTCTVAGLESYECSICGATKTEDIPALGHLFDDVYESDWVAISNEYHARQCQREGCGQVVTEAHRDVTEVVEPTCTTDGYTHHKCVICGHEYQSDHVSALGHELVYVSLDSEPTGGEPISVDDLQGHHLVCDRCDYVDDETEPHDFTRVVTDMPTSEAAGKITYHCEECNFYYTVDIPQGSYSFANDEWDTIAEISALGAADGVYQIGDEKEVTIDSTTYTARIIGFDHDDLSETETDTTYNGGIGKAGITIELEECVGTNYVNSSAVNTGGWASSDLKTYLSGTVLEELPCDLKSVIKTVSKTSNNGEGSSINLEAPTTTTDEQLFCLALAEVYSEKGISNSSNYRINNQAYTPVYLEEGTQYEYYKDVVGDTDPATGSTSTVKTLASDENHNPVEWWFRTAQPTGATGWFYTSTTGVVGGTACNTTGYGVSFAFCI